MNNRTIKNHSTLDLDCKQDFINLTYNIALSAEGVFFKIGDEVCHEGSNMRGERAIILEFDEVDNGGDGGGLELNAITTKGRARICFLYHPE